MARQRITWALNAQQKNADQNKQASPPPQIPAVDRTEPPSHPAYYPDPNQDKYEKGNTSEWAEDPDTANPESPPPAMPGNLTTEPLTHPATSDFSKNPESPEQAAAAGGGAGKKAAEGKPQSLKEMAEARANLAVRIASAIMKDADTAAVEAKALELMDLDEDKLRATAATLNLIAGDDDEEAVIEEDEEDIEIEGSKKKKATDARLARLEDSVGKLVTAMGNFFGMEDSMDEDKSQTVEMTGPGEGSMSEKELLAFLLSAEDMDGDGVDQNDARYGYSEKKSDDEEMEMGEEAEEAPVDDEAGTDEEAEKDDEEFGSDDESKFASDTDRMLKAMLAEMDAKKEAGKLEEKDVEALASGKGIQSGEGGNVNPDPAPETPEVEGPQTGGTAVKNADEQSPTENDIQLSAGVDPLGLVDTGTDKQANDELLALCQDLELPKTAQDDQDEMSDEDEDIGGGEVEEEMEETEEEVEASKSASEVKLRPQAKTASKGAQKLGNVAAAGHNKEARSEINELQKLWESAPDVSAVFGVPRS
jgi:hypothetical protein